MIRIVSIIFATLFAFASLATPVKRTPAQLQADIAHISSQTQALDNALRAFPTTGGTLSEALAVHTDSINIISSLRTANAHALTTKLLSETDAQAILSLVRAFEPFVEDALHQIVVKKFAFQNLPVSGIPTLIHNDLLGLNATTITFDDSVIALFPADLRASAISLRNHFAELFRVAIAAYT